MENKTANLKDGSEWAEHEDCIVGDEQGLKNLINACEVALEKGEYFGSELGDYVGVKKIKSSWFKNPVESKSSRFQNYLLGLILIILFALFIIGAFTIVKWFAQ